MCVYNRKCSFSNLHTFFLPRFQIHPQSECDVRLGRMQHSTRPHHFGRCGTNPTRFTPAPGQRRSDVSACLCRCRCSACSGNPQANFTFLLHALSRSGCLFLHLIHHLQHAYIYIYSPAEEVRIDTATVISAQATDSQCALVTLTHLICSANI